MLSNVQCSSHVRDLGELRMLPFVANGCFFGTLIDACSLFDRSLAQIPRLFAWPRRLPPPGASKVTVTTRLRLVAGLFATSSARSFRKIFLPRRLGEGTFPKGGRRSFRKAVCCQDLSERSSGKAAANERLASDWQKEPGGATRPRRREEPPPAEERGDLSEDVGRPWPEIGGRSRKEPSSAAAQAGPGQEMLGTFR